MAVMTVPTYPAARLVADGVQAHFARHITAARASEGVDFETPPTLAIASIPIGPLPSFSEGLS